MAFVHHLPAQAEAAYLRAYREKDPSQWLYIVKLCVAAGITDPNKLADIPFHLAHPELYGRAIQAHEEKLKAEWFFCKTMVYVAVPFAKDANKNPDRWDGARGRLRTWLRVLKPHHLPVPETRGLTAQMIANTRDGRSRFHEYISKAMDSSIYDTSYISFNYYTGGVTDRSHGRPADMAGQGSVIGLERSGRFNALNQLLEFARKESKDKEKEFGFCFLKVEKHFWSNVHIVNRWVTSGAHSDGTNNFKTEVEIVKSMYHQCKREHSIYSVHRKHITATYKAMTDEHPSTAGLPRLWGD